MEPVLWAGNERNRTEHNGTLTSFDGSSLTGRCSDRVASLRHVFREKPLMRGEVSGRNCETFIETAFGPVRLVRNGTQTPTKVSIELRIFRESRERKSGTLAQPIHDGKTETAISDIPASRGHDVGVKCRSISTRHVRISLCLDQPAE